MPHDVFISYASNDKQIADAICAKLDEQGVRCWIASRDIRPSENRSEAIIKAIDNASVLVLIFSSRANGSPNVIRDAGRAVEDGIPIIPLRIENVESIPSLHSYIGPQHRIDALTPPIEAHIPRLALMIGKLAPHIVGLAGAPKAQIEGKKRPQAPLREEGGAIQSEKVAEPSLPRLNKLEQPRAIRNQQTHDVFISYSSKNKKIADEICAKLEADGIRCWIAPRDIEPGNYGGSIVKGIKSSRVFVLVLSQHSNVSKHVHNEVEIAHKKELTIIPFRIRDVDLSPELEYHLANKHWIEAIKPPCEEPIKELIQKVKTCL